MHCDLSSYFLPTALQEIDIQRGDILFRQNQETSGLYQVMVGSVTLRRSSFTGELLTLHKANAGEYFAEASIFSDHYHCDAVCTEAGKVRKISKNAIKKAMRSDPNFSEEFTRLLAVQVQQYRAHLELIAIRSAKERVLAAIQAGYFTTTIQGLASRLNLTHEACYRALRVLCDEGRMRRIGRGQYVLEHEKGARKRPSFSY